MSGALASAIEAELVRRRVALRPGRSGWLSGRCPLHEDRRPSFGVNFTTGRWSCLAGCGGGGLTSLAQHLGVQAAWRDRRGHLRLPPIEVEVEQ